MNFYRNLLASALWSCIVNVEIELIIDLNGVPKSLS